MNINYSCFPGYLVLSILAISFIVCSALILTSMIRRRRRHRLLLQHHSRHSNLHVESLAGCQADDEQELLHECEPALILRASREDIDADAVVLLDKFSEGSEMAADRSYLEPSCSYSKNCLREPSHD